jgi:hypothetical protein
MLDTILSAHPLRKLMKHNRWLILVTAAPFVLAAVILIFWYLNANRGASFTPIDFLWDIHGIALNPQDESMLYVATHLGLVRGTNEAQWELIGTDQSDFMGFAIDPTQPSVMYSSGHPQIGQPPRTGLLGFRRSADAGQNWNIVQFYGEKDLHSIAVSPVQPKRIYVWDGRSLLRSDDSGQNWTTPEADGLDYTAAQFENGVNTLIADPRDADRVWAATNQGLFWSDDAGENWQPTLPFYQRDITTVEIRTDISLVYSADYALWVGEGDSWLLVSHNLQERIIDFSLSSDLSVWYAASNKAIYKSSDEGKTWVMIRDIGTPQ